MTKVIEVFYDIHMHNGHDGLERILKDDGTKLDKGQVAVFINTSWTALKMLTPDRVLLHFKQPGPRPIDPNTIPYLPTCINGNKLDYSKALDAAVRSQFSQWKKQRQKGG